MNVGIEMMTGNIGMSFTNVILLVVVIASLIFMAIKFEIGAIMLMVTTGVLFVLFYNAHLDYVPTLVVFFIALVMLTISLLAQKTESGVAG